MRLLRMFAEVKDNVRKSNVYNILIFLIASKSKSIAAGIDRFARIINLNRPKALNSLNLEMVQNIVSLLKVN